MLIRKLHRVIGMIMVLPFLGWAVTGIVFFLKPGYAGAYESLQVKTYPLNAPLTIAPDPSWQEVKYLKTVLGLHLLVRTAQGWQQLDPATMTLRAKPTESELRLLLSDAFTTNSSRYGEIREALPDSVITSTNVRISLDWNRLSLQQRGPDTRRIDWLYKIHYLQWTGVKAVDEVLGVVGLVLVVSLAGLGLLLQTKFMKSK